jgi:GT2 family glycosyltransferase
VPAVSGSPSVTILIPFRDQARLLARCLQSLRAVTPPARLASAGVILIDNGSVQSATKKLLAAEARRSEVRVLRIDEPFNYARLNNRAAELATGEFLLLLNNDIEIVLPHWLDALLHAAQQPQTGAVGAKLLFPDGRIQHAGVELGLGDIAGHPFRLAPSHTPAASRPRECSAVTGACLLTPRALYNRLGGLDETHLPVAYNDVDYCLRVREAGLRVLYEPQAVLLHHESVSRGAVNDPREAAYMVRRWARAFDDPFKTQ